MGGSSLKEFLSMALRQIMTDELVLNYTWHKQKETNKIGGTRVSNILYQAAINCTFFAGPDNKTEYKQTMLTVFKVTKQRCRKKLKKSTGEKGKENLEKQMDDAIANIAALLESDHELSGSEAHVEDVGDDSSSDVEDENFR
ncbi:uncharacterized protein LOC127290345 [Leptopilina boulardi]|uniref:uncharacterized protein LOC127290345 n=1 Tax=Leptopilina boulardi TaxID=63433 RepID=UPI0021F607F5|nr:uncharacterized protein LOC127290345 [Leptopilina boulardi]XP_051174804.1 uncharacterized protein LOC127290345 [Leptopilina boulardi]